MSAKCGKKALTVEPPKRINWSSGVYFHQIEWIMGFAFNELRKENAIMIIISGLVIIKQKYSEVLTWKVTTALEMCGK